MCPLITRQICTARFALYLYLTLALAQIIVVSHGALTREELYHQQRKKALPPVFSDGTDHSDHQHSSHLPNLMSTSFSDSEPEFVEQVPNVTVSVGRDAKFPCKVNKLDTYRVGWVRIEDKSILTISHQVVTRNSRISLTQSEHKTWTLHIKNVQESDRGGYMCQVNTLPMKSQVGYLDVTGR